MKANRAFCAPMTRRNAAAKQLLDLLPPVIGWSQPSGGEAVYTITLRHEFEDREGDLCRNTLSVSMARPELVRLVARLQEMLDDHPEDGSKDKGKAW